MSNPSNSAPNDPHESPITPATLREIGLFGALSDDVVGRLARTLKTIRALPGDTIFREGDGLAREMYVVLEGEIGQELVGFG